MRAGAGRHPPQRVAARQAGQHPAGLLPHRGRPHAGPLRAGRPGRVTAELASVFRSAVERAGLDFDVDCPPLDEPVYVDRDMWEKVVLNLLSNALKFTFEGSHHRSACAARARDAVVTVSDTGIGVPAAEMPRLFERFHRIETRAGAVQRGQRNRAGAGARSWWACTAAPSPPTAPRARAPRSPSACPSAPRTCPPTRRRRPARRPAPAPRRRRTVRAGGAALAARRRTPATPAPSTRAGRDAGRRPAAGAGAGRRRQRRHARVPDPAAAQRRLRGRRGQRRAAGARARPRRACPTWSSAT